MKKITLSALLFCGVLATSVFAYDRVSSRSKESSKEIKKEAKWTATGTLLEACSCAVPCPCNFGQSPTRGYCHTIYAYKLKTAEFEGVKLDGLVFGGGEGDKGAFGFLDSKATEKQRPALQKIAFAIFGKGGASGGLRKFAPTRIATSSDSEKFKVDFGDSGGFEADILIGRDGKNPIIVENNTTWPVNRFIKGKTSRFKYHDSIGNKLEFDGVNANLGEFKLSSGMAGANSCCDKKK